MLAKRFLTFLHGHAGTNVWCRVVGDELVITARTGSGLGRIGTCLTDIQGS